MATSVWKIALGVALGIVMAICATYAGCAYLAVMVATDKPSAAGSPQVVPVADLVELRNITSSELGGYLEVKGIAHNTSLRNLDYAWVKVEYLGSDGSVVAVDRTRLASSVGWPLKAGESREWRVTEPAPGIVSYQAKIDTE